ncbi:ABC transporter type 1, transmembrane domain [Syntrophomonas zehnderi OL-4]|uniref:ABC transporter type 1, transmembrane domain n=1 Tax=Syntrophomonas zehnderi OL-4 TaxID=690567 RepID=A0A0E4C7J8_9FIRM|nr:thiol reductant ABC exporter subunit CydC [Syntrophomonas zehnderi]CFX01271.1 ABC transporter type 1, transmembrane domain [Syntrophomonas zehnderi OL-4]
MKTTFRLAKLRVPYWKLIVLGVLLAFLTISSNMGLLIASAFLLSWSALKPSVMDLMKLIATVRFFGLSRAVFRYGERYTTHQAALAILGNIRNWVYLALASLSPGQLQNYHSGQLLSRLVTDVEKLQEIYLRVLLPPLIALLVFIATFVFLLQFHWSLAIFFACLYFLAALGIPLLVKRLTKSKTDLTRSRELLNTYLTDSIKGLTEITAFRRASDTIEIAAGQDNSLTRWQNQLASRNALTGTLTQLISHLAMYTTLLLAVYLVSKGELKGIWIAPLALGVLASFEAVQNLAHIIPNLEDSISAGKRVLELVDTPPAVIRPHLEETWLPLPNYNLAVNNLSFTYPDSNQPALEGINLYLHHGNKIGIVGASGSGKSTLAHLLLGFWRYEEGSIMIGGRELNSFPEEILWSTLGIVSRQTYLFNATIKENILLAKPDATEEELLKAVAKAQLIPHLEKLPKGLDTKIGEDGWKLSGGQRQLVALARIFLSNPPILILDEATEGLDPITEQEVLIAVKELMEHRSAIFVTHRLLGLEEMDEIIVLAQGKIAEKGRHQDLINKPSLYRKMYQATN